MAVITLAITDGTPKAKAWETPPTPDTLRSPIPQGILVFSGTGTVLAKDAANQTSVQLSLVMPEGFAYLPRSAELRFESEDLVNDFGDNGLGFYTGSDFPSGQNPHFNVQSIGEIVHAATNADRIWTPQAGTPKLLLRETFTFDMRVADMSSDASPAGVASYYAEFYVFKVDQIDKWEINTPIPVISHVAF